MIRIDLRKEMDKEARKEIAKILNDLGIHAKIRRFWLLDNGHPKLPLLKERLPQKYHSVLQKLSSKASRRARKELREAIEKREDEAEERRERERELRSGPITDKQKGYLRGLGYNKPTEGLTKLQASKIISTLEEVQDISDEMDEEVADLFIEALDSERNGLLKSIGLDESYLDEEDDDDSTTN